LLYRHVPAVLADMPIADLTPAKLRSWVAGLRNQRKEHAGAVRLTQWRVDGLRGVMKTALRAANTDPLLLAKGLGALTTAAATGSPRETPAARKLILERHQITALLEACDDDLRRFCHMLDVTGARPSQIARLTYDDLDLDRKRVMIPRSAKGRPGSRRSDAIPFPVTDELLAELIANAMEDGLLLHRPVRKHIRPTVWQIVGWAAWTKNAWVRPFRAAVKAAGLPAGITIYALRHSRIVTMLLRGFAAQAVAAQLDTSEPMLRRHYAKWIGHHEPVQAQIRAMQAQEIMPVTTPDYACGEAPSAYLHDKHDPVHAAVACIAKIDETQSLMQRVPRQKSAGDLRADIQRLRQAGRSPSASARPMSLLKPSRRREQRILKDIDKGPAYAVAYTPDRRTR
jgi:integrase